MTKIRSEAETKAAEEFETKQIEILAQIPQEFRDLIARMAWERAHANGYQEILWYVDEYVDTLKGPIAAFAQRVKREEGAPLTGKGPTDPE